MKTAATVQQKRSRRSLSKTDRFTLATFVGIPTLLQIILLWVPAVVTIILSLRRIPFQYVKERIIVTTAGTQRRII